MKKLNFISFGLKVFFKCYPIWNEPTQVKILAITLRLELNRTPSNNRHDIAKTTQISVKFARGVRLSFANLDVAQKIWKYQGTSCVCHDRSEKLKS